MPGSILKQLSGSILATILKAKWRVCGERVSALPFRLPLIYTQSVKNIGTPPDPLLSQDPCPGRDLYLASAPKDRTAGASDKWKRRLTDGVVAGLVRVGDNGKG